MVVEIIIILVLIIFNGVLSASEIAIVSTKKARLQILVDQNNRNAKTVLNLKENPNRFLSTVQIGITLIGILTGYFSGGSISSFIAKHLSIIPVIAPYSAQIAIIFVVIVITYLSLVVGELVPKRIGMAIPETYAMLIAKPMSILGRIVKPFVWILSASTDFIVRLFNIKSTQNTVTEEEIKAMVDEGVEGGIIENIEHDMVDRVLHLGNKKAINLMVHRSRITYLDLNNTFEDNKQFILSDEHTEYPVCDGNFDNVLGIVRIKTLFNAYLTQTDLQMQTLIQPIPFVNENSYAYAVLETLKKSKVSQAVVVDEYGSPQGIITMKDIVSSLVGEIEDEDDDESSFRHRIRARDDGSYIVDGSYQINDFFDFFEIMPTPEDFEEIGSVTTVAGLVFLLLDHIPEEGNQIIFKTVKFEVLDMDGHRIDKVLVSITPKSQVSDETSNID